MIRPILCMLLSLVFLPTIVIGEQISIETLSKLTKLSGADKQVAGLSEIAWSGFVQGTREGPTIPPEELAKVKEAMESAFNSSDMMKTIKNEIRAEITEEEGLELISWYQSKAGVKITSAEEKASSNQAIQQMFKEARFLMEDQKKVKTAIRIDQLVNGTEMTLCLQRYSGIALFTAFESLKNPDTPVNIADFNTRMYAQEQQARGQAQKLTILSLVFCYKDIEQTVVDEYIEFLKTPTSRRYTKNAMEGFKEAFRKSTDQMATLLAELAREQLKTIDK